MEQKIKLTTATHFNLCDDELRRMYALLALFQYPYKREPNYNEAELLKRFSYDLYRFNKEIIKIRKTDPNNLILSQIQNFIQQHYGNLKVIIKDES